MPTYYSSEASTVLQNVLPLSTHVTNLTNPPRHQMSSFKTNHSVEKRRLIAKRILSKYEDRVPVIVEAAQGRSSKSIPPLEKTKFLVANDTTVGKFLFEIRKQLSLRPEAALFLFVGNGVLPPTAALMSQIYDRYKDKEDNLLYFQLSTENTFGAQH